MNANVFYQTFKPCLGSNINNTVYSNNQELSFSPLSLLHKPQDT